MDLGLVTFADLPAGLSPEQRMRNLLEEARLADELGYELDDYDELFEEKLELLIAIRDSERVFWHGKHRAPLEDVAVWPRPVQDQLPIWVAVGGTPQSVVRAAVLGLPLTLAIIGGETARFQAFAELYRRVWAEAGHEGEPRIAINTHAFVADSEQAADAAFGATYLE